MKTFLLVLAVVVSAILTGCSALGVVRDVEPRAPERITVRCGSSYPHGCRHNGQIVAWEDWLEMKGYAADTYKITGKNKVGSATNLVLEKR